MDVREALVDQDIINHTSPPPLCGKHVNLLEFGKRGRLFKISNSWDSPRCKRFLSYAERGPIASSKLEGPLNLDQSHEDKKHPLPTVKSFVSPLL